MTRAGQRITGLDVRGCIDVQAPNVVIQNSKVSQPASGCYTLIKSGSSGLLVRNVELDGGGDADVSGIAATNYVAERLDIHGVGDGAGADGNVTIRDSYIHDLVEANGSHNDGIQTTQGSGIVIEGNRIENPHTQTSAIMIGADLGNVGSVTVSGNLLAGGGYALYAGARPPGGRSLGNIQVTRNVFSSVFFPSSGYYGAITASADPAITVSDNVWQSSGKLVVPGR